MFGGGAGGGGIIPGMAERKKDPREPQDPKQQPIPDETGTYALEESAHPPASPQGGDAPTGTLEVSTRSGPTLPSEGATGTMAVRDAIPEDDPGLMTMEPMAGTGRPRIADAIILKGEEAKAPHLWPPAPGRVLGWPLQGEHAPAFIGRCFLMLFVCAGSWIFQDTPYAGVALRVLILASVGFAVAFYAVRATLAGVSGAPTPPPFVRLSAETGALGESFGVLFLTAVYLLPGILAASFFGWHPLVLLPALAGYMMLPASLLLLSAGGLLRYANPRLAFGVMETGGFRYLLVALPGALLYAFRLALLRDPRFSFAGAVVEGLGFPVLVYTGLAAGLMARERERLADLLLQVGRWADGTEDPLGEEPEDTEAGR